jgi:hypothetical protein
MVKPRPSDIVASMGGVREIKKKIAQLEHGVTPRNRDRKQIGALRLLLWEYGVEMGHNRPQKKIKEATKKDRRRRDSSWPEAPVNVKHRVSILTCGRPESNRRKF